MDRRNLEELVHWVGIEIEIGDTLDDLRKKVTTEERNKLDGVVLKWAKFRLIGSIEQIGNRYNVTISVGSLKGEVIPKTKDCDPIELQRTVRALVIEATQK